MLVEAGDLERPGDVVAWGDEDEAALTYLATRLDERSERGRVDEVDLGQVDDHAAGAIGGQLLERSGHVRSVVEVELARETQNDGVTVTLDRFDRRHA